MDLNHPGYQILFLSFDEWFLVVVSMATDWASFFGVTFIPLKLFKTFKTSFVVYMRTTQDCLLVKLKVFETNWACFVLYSILNSFEEIGFNVLPFSLAKWLRRFINKPKTFSKAKFVNVLHPFFLDIIISTLFTFLSLSKH